MSNLDRWQKAVQANPKDPEAHFRLGNAYASNNDRDEAVLHWRMAINLNENHLGAHNNLGALLAKEDSFDDALDYFKKALEIEPNSFPALANYAKCLKDVGRQEEAIYVYENIIEAISENMAAEPRSNRLRDNYPGIMRLSFLLFSILVVSMFAAGFLLHLTGIIH